jgi:hypothetical protein
MGSVAVALERVCLCGRGRGPVRGCADGVAGVYESVTWTMDVVGGNNGILGRV